MSLDPEHYAGLAGFRSALRRFLAASEAISKAAGVTQQQYQALLAIKTWPFEAMTITDLSEATAAHASQRGSAGEQNDEGRSRPSRPLQHRRPERSGAADAVGAGPGGFACGAAPDRDAPPGTTADPIVAAAEKMDPDGGPATSIDYLTKEKAPLATVGAFTLDRSPGEVSGVQRRALSRRDIIEQFPKTRPGGERLSADRS